MLNKRPKSSSNTRTPLFALGVFLVALTSCTPIENERQKSVDHKTGFISKHAFQVQCKEPVLSPGDILTPDFQKRLLANCNKAMLKALAHQKILFDFYQKGKKVPISGFFQRPSGRMPSKSTQRHEYTPERTQSSRKLSDTSRHKEKAPEYEVKIDWSDELVASLWPIYDDLLPGRFVLQKRSPEHVEGLYRIEKEMLVLEIKNRKLPFSYKFTTISNLR